MKGESLNCTVDLHPDDVLTGRIRDNDNKAFDLLFKKYYNTLCNFAFGYLKNSALSEEIVSDVFLNVWLKRNEPDTISNIKVYLFVAVRNKALNFLKKKKVVCEKLTDTSFNQTQKNQNPHNELVYDELSEEFEKIVEALPTQRKKIFKLNAFEALKYEEIAQRLSISVSTVHNQMTKVLKYFRNKYPQSDWD